jgi:two-component system sensor histidine kinase KdpD
MQEPGDFQSISPDPTTNVGGYVLAVVGAGLAVGLGALLQRWVGLHDLSLVFMLAVIGVASRTRIGPAVVTAVLCFLAYNYFFIEPRYTFYIGARQGVISVLLFLAAALLAGRMASRLAMQVQALRAANTYATALQELGRRLAIAANEDEVVQAAHTVFRQSLGADIWVRIGDRGIHARGVEPPAPPILRPVESMDEAGKYAETVEEFGWWFLPLRVPGETLGVVGMKLPPQTTQLDQEQRRLVRAMTDDIAQAVVRTRLVADLESERVATETERLRAALLSSVSHDLRSPLASIIGAAGSLESYGEAMSDEDRRSLLETIRLEGERLDRHIQNLLDMTRLGQGGLTLHRDWIGADELIGSAVARLQHYQQNANIQVAIGDEVEPIWVHPTLIEQALFNVIENAVKFSPLGEAVVIDARDDEDGQLRLEVRDQGAGIPEDERHRIFEMFYSAERGDRGRNGTGLGLAISRGMVDAHGGSVDAFAGNEGRGTTIRITLPRLLPDSDKPLKPSS